MNLNIIGAGFTGCISALIHRDLFENVSIYDFKLNPGGILNETSHNDSLYFSGCQFLDVNADWYKKLKQIKNIDFLEFDHQYSSYTNLDDKIFISDDVAGPIFDIKFFDMKNFKIKNYESQKSVLQNFANYPEEIEKKLIEWFNLFQVDINKIHYLSLESIQIPRIFFNENHKEILKIKNNNQTIDNIVGVPRKLLFEDKLIASIPTKGYSHFFKKIKDYLENEKEVDFYLRNNIKLINSPNKIDFNHENIKSSNDDIILWSANPVPLLRNLNYGTIENPYIKVRLFHFDVISGIYKKLLFKYIQVYSLKDRILRIYIYQLDCNVKIVVEAFENSILDDIEKSMKKIFETFCIDISWKFIFTSMQLRHIFFTIDDKDKFDEFNIKSSNIISGAWDSYSRDAKLKKIGLNIEKLKK